MRAMNTGFAVSRPWNLAASQNHTLTVSETRAPLVRQGLKLFASDKARARANHGAAANVLNTFEVAGFTGFQDFQNH